MLRFSGLKQIEFYARTEFEIGRDSMSLWHQMLVMLNSSRIWRHNLWYIGASVKAGRADIIFRIKMLYSRWDSNLDRQCCENVSVKRSALQHHVCLNSWQFYSISPVCVLKDERDPTITLAVIVKWTSLKCFHPSLKTVKQQYNGYICLFNSSVSSSIIHYKVKFSVFDSISAAGLLNTKDYLCLCV